MRRGQRRLHLDACRRAEQGLLVEPVLGVVEAFPERADHLAQPTDPGARVSGQLCGAVEKTHQMRLSSVRVACPRRKITQRGVGMVCRTEEENITRQKVILCVREQLN